MVYLQECKGVFTATIPNVVIKKMKLKKGDQLAFVADSDDILRVKVVR